MNWIGLCFSLLSMLIWNAPPNGQDILNTSDCNSSPFSTEDNLIIDGISFVGPPEPFPKDPISPINEVGADWIAVIPFAYSRQNIPKVFYNSQWQWWGEKPEGVQETIQLAKAGGLSVMLKPQLYVPGSWPGGLDYPSDKEWTEWELSYEKYILPFAEMAEKEKVEALCIGTEFKISTSKREAFWRQLIKKIRGIYSGKLIYAANWDEFANVPFWDELDYVGIDAYFPLVDMPTPSVAALVAAWQPWVKKIENFYNQVDKPIVFTEFGYLSVDGCAYNTWELESKINQLNINEWAQANAIEALFQVFWKKEYWRGGFLWKWFPNMKGHEGYPDKDYTPQGKIAHQTLQNWYKQVGKR